MAQPETAPPVTGTPTPHPALRADLPAGPGGEKPKQPFFYGGPAAIEGGMMRGKSHYAVAGRLPTTKEIVIERGELKAPIWTHPCRDLPFVRGLAVLRHRL